MLDGNTPTVSKWIQIGLSCVHCSLPANKCNNNTSAMSWYMLIYRSDYNCVFRALPKRGWPTLNTAPEHILCRRRWLKLRWLCRHGARPHSGQQQQLLNVVETPKGCFLGEIDQKQEKNKTEAQKTIFISSCSCIIQHCAASRLSLGLTLTTQKHTQKHRNNSRKKSTHTHT